jgi:hypothetical protein
MGCREPFPAASPTGEIRRSAVTNARRVPRRAHQAGASEHTRIHWRSRVSGQRAATDHPGAASRIWRGPDSVLAGGRAGGGSPRDERARLRRGAHMCAMTLLGEVAQVRNCDVLRRIDLKRVRAHRKRMDGATEGDHQRLPGRHDLGAVSSSNDEPSDARTKSCSCWSHKLRPPSRKSRSRHCRKSLPL